MINPFGLEAAKAAMVARAQERSERPEDRLRRRARRDDQPMPQGVESMRNPFSPTPSQALHVDAVGAARKSGTCTYEAVVGAVGPLNYGSHVEHRDAAANRDPAFLRSLIGIPLFHGHPDGFAAGRQGGGKVTRAWNDRADSVLVEVEVWDPSLRDAMDREPGVSLGYLANTVVRDGRIYQRGLVADHLAVAVKPRCKTCFLTGNGSCCA